ncbi:transposase [Methylobacterium sp. Leaf106]|nr:transposase [Methylobacterium sp. Leaf106]
MLILDGAGWHIADDLVVPDTITVSPLPSHAPELNPVETVCQFVRDNRLGDTIFASHEDIPDRCCAAWNKLVAQPRCIMSLGLRNWAYR